MPVGYCPDPECDSPVDMDGFGEHGVPTLWYCRCKRVYTHGPEFMDFTEVPKDELDLTERFQYGAAGRIPQPGEFILALRWGRIREAAHKTAWISMSASVRRLRSAAEAWGAMTEEQQELIALGRSIGTGLGKMTDDEWEGALARFEKLLEIVKQQRDGKTDGGS